MKSLSLNSRVDEQAGLVCADADVSPALICCNARGWRSSTAERLFRRIDATKAPALR